MRSADPKLFAELAERPAGFSQLHEPFSVEDFSRSPEDFTLRSRCFQTGKRALGNPDPFLLSERCHDRDDGVLEDTR